MRSATVVAVSLLLGACGAPLEDEQREQGVARPAEHTAVTNDMDWPPESARSDAGLVAGLRLPATFTGTLPCADCEGIYHHLDLWPDGVFHLRQEWLGTPGVEYDRGRWRQHPDRAALLLSGGQEVPLWLEVKGPTVLRKLDIEGRPIHSDLPYELISDATLTPVDLSLGLHGMFRYLADAALFEECLTGRTYPVAMTGDYLNLERAYLRAEKVEPGAPLLATFEGDIGLQPAMEGDRLIPTVSVRRYIGLFPDQSCERSMSQASLTNTYWKIVRFGEAPVAPVGDNREPHMLLRGPERGYTATAGCNQFGGNYQVEGDRIQFNPGPATLMACPPPLAELEDTLVGVLGSARSWAIYSQVLEFVDESGVSIATFEAVYLP